MAAKDLTGQKFGRWRVIERAESSTTKYVYWLCECECGTRKQVRNDHLISGRSTSCGCYLKEMSSTLHGTHHMSDSRLYGVWVNMKTRCYNKNNRAYADYGGRGIKICDEWLDFENFHNWAIANGYDENAEVGECTVERMNVNGNYEPSNCKFVTRVEQANNKRNTVVLTHDGESKTLSQWANETGIDSETIRCRLDRGYNVDQALTKSTDIYKFYATINGITKPVKKWCEELNLPYKTVLQRIKTGMSPEDALTKPIGGIKHYDDCC